MAEITILRARLRARDKDIQDALAGLNLSPGELADLIREGLRKILSEKGLTQTRPISINDAQSIAKQLMSNIKKERRQ